MLLPLHGVWPLHVLLSQHAAHAAATAYVCCGCGFRGVEARELGDSMSVGSGSLGPGSLGQD